ncbi:MAG: HIRAN domain-containing protein [Deltaproteobacteria bacterium]|nr:HIRAN domain-containing protein [Deltaproteobacteria bacterium]
MADNSPLVINLDQKNLVSFLQESKALGSSHPLSQRIFLLEVHVAGTTHVQGIESLTADLKADDRLDFFREADNPHDELAIVVKSGGEKLGYVPRNRNEVLARLMDAGKLVYGVLREKEKVGKWLRLTIRIFLED